MKTALLSILFPTALLCSFFSSGMNNSAQTCPDRFHSIPLMQNARLCHQFGDTPPASLSYFAPVSPANVVSFYRQHFPQSDSLQQKERMVITLQGLNGRLVISPDPHGSQIDILISPAP